MQGAMRPMKKYRTALLFFAVLFLSSFGTAKADTYHMVTMDFPPYSYMDKGNATGIGVDIIIEAFKRMGHDVKIDVLPWARSLSMVKKGKVDAIFTIFKNPERETFLDYSNTVIIPEIVSLFTLKDTPIMFDGDLSELADYRFGLRNQLSYGVKFDAALNDGTLKKAEIVDAEESTALMLLKGRIDIMPSNRLVALMIFKELGILDKVNELKPYMQNVPSYIAFSKKRNLATVRDEYDKTFAAMEQEGVIKSIINNYTGE